MKSTISRIKEFFAITAGAIAIAGFAAIGFGSATANATPPDPCAAACHNGGVYHSQPLSSPGLRSPGRGGR